MRAEALEPQMSQMYADISLQAFALVDLPNLWLSNSDKALREFLRMIRV